MNEQEPALQRNGGTASDWDHSAAAWINVIGTEGDWGRRFVLDSPMLARATAKPVGRALDLGCGEGRFCRMLQASGIATIGIDPTAALIEQARRLDSHGEYHLAGAESLPLADACVDLVVAYLSLIDISELHQAIREVRRVLRVGGRFLIANLQPFNTAAIPQGWTREPDGSRRFCIDDYFSERPVEAAWLGIRVRNWHRPLSTYMTLLLDAGFTLSHFAEPEPQGVDDDKARRYRRVPNFFIMEWHRDR